LARFIVKPRLVCTNPGKADARPGKNDREGANAGQRGQQTAEHATGNCCLQDISPANGRV
jgi:hypothetical protein